MTLWIVMCGVVLLVAVVVLVLLRIEPPTEEEDDVIIDDLRLSLVPWPQTGSGYGDLDEAQR